MSRVISIVRSLECEEESPVRADALDRYLSAARTGDSSSHDKRPGMAVDGVLIGMTSAPLLVEASQLKEFEKCGPGSSRHRQDCLCSTGREKERFSALLSY